MTGRPGGVEATAQPSDRSTPIAPGSIVVVRDEEWLVTNVEPATDGQFVHVQGLSELVRETDAIFSTALDVVEPLDPAAATIVADDSPGYRRAKLWVESTLRKTAAPMGDMAIPAATGALADVLGYQQAAVRQALDPANLRPRILLADAVGLGKTLEIGMILSELVRRGRGERILVVTPRHVLEQAQHELWTRFALPFVRLDSVGIQRIRQKLPATRNPFTYYKRVIVSIDTLKSDQYLAHLEKQHWGAVVIDESHNVTNASAGRSRLARLLARRCDALILASATPHNGKKESFAALVRMLEPSAVSPEGDFDKEALKRLVIRRHRHSPDVASEVGNEWAERLPPNNIMVPASAAEDAVAVELNDSWLHPPSGSSPYSGENSALFPWTLAKAFLSSPAALGETVKERRRKLDPASAGGASEILALDRLSALNDDVRVGSSAKYQALVDHLRSIGVGKGKPTRAVVFSERVATLQWLRERLVKDLKLPGEAVVVMHGQLADEEQQRIVESFKQASSPIRVLVTGDVASEGVNLHLQCHHLVHYDIPWSLIRIEQRNGRIDRYGQKHSPQITTLLLNPSTDRFAGDLRLLTKLMEKEHEAHHALGDVASLMGEYSVEAEERAIRKVLAGKSALEDEVADVSDVAAGDGLEALLAQLAAAGGQAAPSIPTTRTGIYGSNLEYLDDAVHEVFPTPVKDIKWKRHDAQSLVEMAPPPDLASRLGVLPQTYLKDRDVTTRLVLATSVKKADDLLALARGADSTSTWPEAHFLGPLHPVLDWIGDRALAKLNRNEVFAVRGAVDVPTVLTHGVLTNKKGQVVASSFVLVQVPNLAKPGFAPAEAVADADEAWKQLGVAETNTGAVDVSGLDGVVVAAVRAAEQLMAGVTESAAESVRDRVTAWQERVRSWEEESDELVRRKEIRARKDRRDAVDDERRIADEMLPAQRLVRPLLVVLGEDH